MGLWFGSPAFGAAVASFLCTSLGVALAGQQSCAQGTLAGRLITKPPKASAGVQAGPSLSGAQCNLGSQILGLTLGRTFWI